MNKLFLAVAALGVVFFTSCGGKELPKEEPKKEEPKEDPKEDPKEETQDPPASLEGTYWKGTWDYGDGVVVIDEMVFTSTTATFNATQKDGGNYSTSFCGRYIYDPAKGEFVMPNDSPQPYPPNEEIGTIPDLEGTIKDGVMTFLVWQSFDMCREIKLKQQ